MSQKTLEQYFRDDYDRNVIDHSLRAHVDGEGKVKFYIHPSNVGGDTLDFVVEGNNLVPVR